MHVTQPAVQGLIDMNTTFLKRGEKYQQESYQLEIIDYISYLWCFSIIHKSQICLSFKEMTKVVLLSDSTKSFDGNIGLSSNFPIQISII